VTFTTNKITFTSPLEGYISHPKPATHFIPEAFKKFKTGEIPNDTVKGCMPFLDSLVSGYIIPTPIAIKATYYMEKEEETLRLDIPNPLTKFPNLANLVGLSSHSPKQFPNSMMNDKALVPHVFKFHNPWKIKTPPGYSCLFTQPFNKNLDWKIIDAIVDTDNFDLEINFPFFWTKPLELNEQYYVDSGVPMVQVIPFKRENWKMETKVAYEDKQRSHHVKSKDLDFLKLFSTRFKDWYKFKSWNKKSFK
jgi:hypothetical protein